MRFHLRAITCLAVLGLVLGLSATPAFAVADQYEPDNAMAEASVLSSAAPQWHTTDGMGTEDWIAIDVIAGRSYDLRFEYIMWSVAGTVEMHAYNAAGNALAGVSRDEWWWGLIGRGNRYRYLADTSQRIYVRLIEHTSLISEYRALVIDRRPNTFSGTVRMQPVSDSAEGWTVRLRQSVDADTMLPGTVLDTSVTGPSGEYHVETSLDDIDVTVEFVSPDVGRWPSGYWGEPLFPTWYVASFVNLPRTETLMTVDWPGLGYGGVAGVVSDEQGPAPDVGVNLEVFREGWARWITAESTTSSAQGEYSFSTLDSRKKWRITISDPVVGRLDPQGSRPATLTPGAVSQVDVSLVAGGSIQGLIADEVSGVPIAGANVELYIYSEPDAHGYRRTVSTDANGHYKILGLYPGSYCLRFARDAESYRAEWYGGDTDVGARTQVDVSWGTAVTANGELNPDGTPPVTTLATLSNFQGRTLFSLDSRRSRIQRESLSTGSGSRNWIRIGGARARLSR